MASFFLGPCAQAPHGFIFLTSNNKSVSESVCWRCLLSHRKAPFAGAGCPCQHLTNPAGGQGARRAPACGALLPEGLRAPSYQHGVLPGANSSKLTPLSARPCLDRLRGNPVCPLGGISWRMGRCVGSGRCVGTQAMEVAGWGSQPKCPPQPHSSRKLSGDPKAAAELSSAPSSPTASELPPKQKGSWSSHCCFLSSGSEKCIFLVN